MTLISAAVSSASWVGGLKLAVENDVLFDPKHITEGSMHRLLINLDQD